MDNYSTTAVQATIAELENELARQYRVQGLSASTMVPHEIVMTDLRIPFRTIFLLVLKIMLAQALVALCLSATIFAAWILFLGQLLAFAR